MASSEISGFRQTVIPSKGIFKKVIELADSSKEPAPGEAVSIGRSKGVSIEFSNGMILTQLPGTNKVTLNKESSEEEFQDAFLYSDGEEVMISNNNYKETIFKDGSIIYRKINGHGYTYGYIVDKDHRKTTAKFKRDEAIFFGTKVQVHRNTNESGKDIYEFDDLAVKPFVSLTELNKIYWPRK